ncbi:MAG: hypothetical protein NTNFB01_00800 [Nitrospira sp.]
MRASPEAGMGQTGRCAGSLVAQCSFLVAVASVDACCEATGKGNQDTCEPLIRVLEKRRNQTGMYPARARCRSVLGSYAPAPSFLLAARA